MCFARQPIYVPHALLLTILYKELVHAHRGTLPITMSVIHAINRTALHVALSITAINVRKVSSSRVWVLVCVAREQHYLMAAVLPVILITVCSVRRQMYAQTAAVL